MSPIKITPSVPTIICRGEREIPTAPPTTEPFEACETVYVQPPGKEQDYRVTVRGFGNAPGGMLESQRLSAGNNVDEITLTTADDPDLSGELGLSEVIIDGVRYTAINPHED